MGQGTGGQGTSHRFMHEDLDGIKLPQITKFRLSRRDQFAQWQMLESVIVPKQRFVEQRRASGAAIPVGCSALFSCAALFSRSIECPAGRAEG